MLLSDWLGKRWLVTLTKINEIMDDAKTENPTNNKLTDTTRDDVRENINLGIWSKWEEIRKG